MYAPARMKRERALDGVLFFAYLAMALSFGWAVFQGDDAIPGAVIVAGGIGAFLVLGETVWYVIRRRRDPDREFR
jgi:hypothetical protein